MVLIFFLNFSDILLEEEENLPGLATGGGGGRRRGRPGHSQGASSVQLREREFTGDESDDDDDGSDRDRIARL